jgi:hypothetical protein
MWYTFERKLFQFDNTIINQTLKGKFKERICINVNCTAIELLLAWKDIVFTVQTIYVQDNTILVHLSFKMDQSKVRITGGHGSSSKNNRDNFIQQMRNT